MINEIFVLGADYSIFQIIGDIEKYVNKFKENFLYLTGPCVRLDRCKKESLLSEDGSVHTLCFELYGEDYNSAKRIKFCFGGVEFVDDSFGRYSVPVPISGLFVDKHYALEALKLNNLSVMDVRFISFTSQTVFAVGNSHPVFFFSKGLRRKILTL